LPVKDIDVFLTCLGVMTLKSLSNIITNYRLGRIAP